MAKRTRTVAARPRAARKKPKARAARTQPRPLAAAGREFQALVDIMARLRGPGGCPWDREQTIESLRGFVLEETYEVLEAIDMGDAGAMREEFGDLLLQVVLQSQIALEAGEFYASSGVELSDVTWKENRLVIRVAPQPGVTYLTQFIGSRRPVDWTHKPVFSTNGYQLAVTRIYSSGMGAVLSEQRGTNVSYTCKGDELYVRAKVISSKPKENGLARDEKETAWTQPVQPVPPPR